MRRNKPVLAIFIVGIVTSSLLIGFYIYTLQDIITSTPKDLQIFKSEYELNRYIETHIVNKRRGIFNIMYSGTYDVGAAEKGLEEAPAYNQEYSLTNVQVEGVDEADYVKTDGRNIYVTDKNEIYIIKAYPLSDISIASKIRLVNQTISGIYVYKNKLIIVAEKMFHNILPLREEAIGETQEAKSILPMTSSALSSIYVYNLINSSQPKLTKNVSFPGWISGTRLMKGILYSIVNEPLFISSKKPRPPSYIIDGKNYTISPSEIYYTNVKDYGFQYTLIFTIDLNMFQYDKLTLLTGFTNILYMSYKNIYLTQTLWHSTPFEKETYYEETTMIYKFKIDRLRINPTAVGEVFGTINNRFQLDEYKGCLRVSTYGWEMINENGQTSYKSYTNLFVLDNDLKIIGSITKIAESEHLYATRFTGDYAYLVTFYRVDPLFVIDLSNPGKPAIIGKLKIPGFSTMLQPLWNNLVLGIGYEQNNKTRLLNLKLSLFDVSEPTEPREIGKLVYDNAWWSWSEASYDPHAILKIPLYHYIGIPIEERKIIYNRSKMFLDKAYLIINVTRDGLEKIGLLKLEPPINISRSFWISYMRGIFIGDMLYIVTNNGISIYELETLLPVNYIIFTP